MESLRWRIGELKMGVKSLKNKGQVKVSFDESLRIS